MEIFRLDGDDKHLYFRNLRGISDDEEFESIMAVLKYLGCKIVDQQMAPYCDVVSCVYQEHSFKVIRTIDGDGNYIYADQPVALVCLEKLFK